MYDTKEEAKKQEMIALCSFGIAKTIDYGMINSEKYCVWFSLCWDDMEKRKK